VIGKDVATSVLQAVTRWSEGTLSRSLAHLQTVGFLAPPRLFPSPIYTFKHILTPEGAHQSLAPNIRRQTHGRVAQVLVAQFPDLAATQPEVLAQHYTEAGETAQAVGYWLQAGQRASQRLAHVEAIAHFTRGLELLKVLPD